jgi:hypothetical protein
VVASARVSRAEIVRGLRALPETRALTRLRFRVGKLRAHGRVARAAGGPRNASGRGVPAEPPAKTLDDALARLRRSVERTRAAHRAGGGTFCALCEAPVDRRPDLPPVPRGRRAAARASLRAAVVRGALA